MADINTTAKRGVERMMVRIEHLDKLLALAGEVIITSSTLHELQRLLQQAAAQNEPISTTDVETVKASNESARRISQELHELVMAIRLVDFGETLRIFRRPVRDLARKLGREVELVFEAEGVLIDKALAERLTDPLLHLLRNAVDHGIETPLERTRAGKPPSGTITVAAKDREHHTEILVTDDGRGLDAAGLFARAKALGMAGVPEDAAHVWDVISRTGFSTSTDVTDTSGRGVGLDIVRNAIAEMDGEIKLASAPGEGVTFTLLVPKLRAVNIIDALTVRAGDGLFAFPIESIVSFVGIHRSDIQTAIGASRYIQYLGDVVTLRNLAELLGGAASDEEIDPLPIVIIRGKSGRLALTVSELLGPQKLVNMPLDEDVFHVHGVMGTAVFSGGRIGLTLAPDQIVDRGLGERADTDTKPAAKTPAASVASTGAARHPSPSVATSSSAGDATSAVSAEKRGGGSTDLHGEDAYALVDELRRCLAELQDALLTLEQNEANHEELHRAFRLLHAAKGNFTMLERDEPARVAHMLETVLDYLRSDRIELSPERADLLLDGVTYLVKVAAALPDATAPLPDDLHTRLLDESTLEESPGNVASDAELVGQTFRLPPTVELQVLAALKRGERTYESFLTFEPGRQADFLVAYLILRRMGLYGNIMATIPSVDEIEKGECGTALKVLWSTALPEAEMGEVMENLGRLYGITEFVSNPTTIFQYKGITSEGAGSDSIA